MALHKKAVFLVTWSVTATAAVQDKLCISALLEMCVQTVKNEETCISMITMRMAGFLFGWVVLALLVDVLLLFTEITPKIEK